MVWPTLVQKNQSNHKMQLSFICFTVCIAVVQEPTQLLEVRTVLAALCTFFLSLG